MATPYLLGVTGGSGSGKTYFLKKLVEALGPENVTMVSHDNYYKNRMDQPKDENGVENFDTPESINFKHFARDVAKLKRGLQVRKIEYTFNKPKEKPNMLTFKPKPIIVLEGIFVFHYKEVSDMIDLKVFIDAAPHIKIKRRILRDSVERGYDLHDVLYRYEKHVMPSYEKYIAVHRNNVDLLITNNTTFDKALDVLTVFLKSKING